ncbi:hypothetical protein [Cohnella sp. REN36]|uniref:hypothetical protein n=1 Tax=Cohnella sp. REN36 TaxID=2887347 RepID=UPI001D147181|nr:hypothetical protein [Cohnella sp. REN36]MCC3373073.1 hypothetical protein [Cohnella sp. REN36]
MEISDDAKVIIAEVLAENDSDCLRVTSQESCCGPTLRFELSKLQEDDSSTSINGVLVVMDSQAKAKAESVMLATKDGALVIEDASPSCCA